MDDKPLIIIVIALVIKSLRAQDRTQSMAFASRELFIQSIELAAVSIIKQPELPRNPRRYA